MKRILILASVAALGSLIGFVAMTSAQSTPPAAQPTPQRPRIAIVNIAKVLRDYQKAASDGKAITAKRQEWVNVMQPKRDKMAELSKQIPTTPSVTEKERLQQQALAINRELEDLERQAQKELGDLTDKTIVEVYQNIKSVINDIAVTNNLDLVMCYPDASLPEDDKKPAVAQLKLQSPALIPFYQRGMDITEVVVVTLNRRHPAPPDAKGVAPANYQPMKK